ncbi:MAG: TRAP-type C4-dicarboxylate transport system, small permease component [Lachnospiraceae bacterium]|jgi:TRAP-type C4-dicarboxylate transport system permease small subunit|nr:TRAP-type C4-dicarboxylate transport system, small permease component [Lachnospiraceae bacterium]
MNFDIAIAGIALVVLIVLTFLGVIMRYVFESPFTWLEEVQLWCMVWIVYAAAGAAFRTGSHVAIEMVVELFPKAVQKVMEVLISLIVIIVIGFLFIQSIGFVELFVRSGRTTNMLSVPYSLIYGMVPVSCILMILNFFYAKYREFKGLDIAKEGE